MKTLPFLQSHSYTENLETTTAMHGPVAISYLRWSSAIQGEGDTLRRQSSKTKEWLAAHPNVRLAQELVDAGVSAFKGKNIQDGAFGAFLAAVQESKIPRGTYLLVESLDRISRLTPEQALSIFLQIINAGIVIVTLMDGQEYRAGQNDMMMVLFKSIMIMATAHEEMAKRSERIKESWAGRTQRARESGKAIKGNLPAWLYYDANGVLQQDEAKVVVVQRIFDMCISGAGITAISQALSAAKVPPLGLAKRKTIKNRSDFWTVTSVAYILRYRAVYGDYHPNKGEPIFGIFPVIVPKEDFHRAEAARERRHNVVRGRSGKHYTNLFKGIAKCHYCGGAMTIQDGRNKRSPNRPRQIQCVGVSAKMCSQKPWNYPLFESAFLSVVREIDTQAIVDGGKVSRADKITQELQTLHGERHSLQKLEESYLKAIDEDDELEPIYRDKVKANRRKINAMSDQITILDAERKKAQAERLASAELLPIELPQDATVRAKVAEHIRTIVECVTLTRDSSSKFGSNFTVHFAGGGTRTVYVDYTNAKRPYAVTGAHGGVDIIPADKETALEMRDYILDDIMKEVEWLDQNGQYEAIGKVIEKMEATKATLERQAREVGLIE
ncbi:recombinase family protein [Mesorhizobium sp.]|uniref:recombinase family protein n=1 Tax=Mesorhizobium sp. TaxID=1871066 RepID=UPI0025C22344|nr:recombinase family protein [Mesorhizobium sp.]